MRIHWLFGAVEFSKCGPLEQKNFDLRSANKQLRDRSIRFVSRIQAWLWRGIANWRQKLRIDMSPFDSLMTRRFDEGRNQEDASSSTADGTIQCSHLCALKIRSKERTSCAQMRFVRCKVLDTLTAFSATRSVATWLTYTGAKETATCRACAWQATHGKFVERWIMDVRIDRVKGAAGHAASGTLYLDASECFFSFPFPLPLSADRCYLVCRTLAECCENSPQPGNRQVRYMLIKRNRRRNHWHFHGHCNIIHRCSPAGTCRPIRYTDPPVWQPINLSASF